MNLRADSGAILMTLMPLPLHNERIPPSLIIWARPLMIHMLFPWDPCTWNRKHRFIRRVSILTNDIILSWHSIKTRAKLKIWENVGKRSKSLHYQSVWVTADVNMTDVHYHSAVTTSDAISYRTNQSAAQRVWLTPQSLIGRLTGLYNYSESRSCHWNIHSWYWLTPITTLGNKTRSSDLTRAAIWLWNQFWTSIKEKCLCK